MPGTEAHTTLKFTGEDLSAKIESLLPDMKISEAAEMEAFLPHIDKDRHYAWRRSTGTSFRVTCFTGAQRCQFTVGNILILSGSDVIEPHFRVACQRKKRSDIFDQRRSLVSCAQIYPLD